MAYDSNPSILTVASNQWASRPDDQRFVSLIDLQTAVHEHRERSIADVISSKRLRAIPDPNNERAGLLFIDDRDDASAATHWSFGQVAALAGAPAGYMRALPAPLAADCINYGMLTRDAEQIGTLVAASGADKPDVTRPNQLRAATGPAYGRVWNSDIVGALINRFGDGLTGRFKVPGEFGKDVEITKRNTTLYASDRDMFVFLADEKNRVTVPNRRNGASGEMARGFIVFNSEVGSQSLGVMFFLFDYVCMNRIIWGVENFKEVRIRHTKTAPDRWLDEVQPTLIEYADASGRKIEETIAEAKRKKIDSDVDDFLKNRFGGRVAAIKAAHEADEGRPIETLWDVVTGATAAARAITHQDARVSFERDAGKILDLVAVK